MTALLFNPLAKATAKPSVFNVTLNQSGLSRTFGPTLRPIILPKPPLFGGITTKPPVKPAVLPPPPSISVTPAVAPPLLNLTPTAAVPALASVASSAGAPSAAGTDLTSLDTDGAPTSEPVSTDDASTGSGGLIMLAGAAFLLYLLFHRKR